MARTITRGYRLLPEQHAFLAHLHACIRDYPDFQAAISPYVAKFHEQADEARALEALAKVRPEKLAAYLRNVAATPAAEPSTCPEEQVCAPSDVLPPSSVAEASAGAEEESSPGSDVGREENHLVAGSTPPTVASHADEMAASASASGGSDPFAGLSSLVDVEGMASAIGKQLGLKPFPLAKMLLHAAVREPDGRARCLYRSEIENIVRRALGVPRGPALSATQRALRLEPDNPARHGRKRPIARALSSDLVAAIHTLHQQGLANAAIAKQMGCDPRTVREALRRPNATSAVAPLAWRSQGPSLEVCSALGLDAYMAGSEGRWVWFLADGGKVVGLGAAHLADRAKEAAVRALRAAARSAGGDGIPRLQPPWAGDLQWQSELDKQGRLLVAARTRSGLLRAFWEGSGWDWSVLGDPSGGEVEPVRKGRALTFKAAATLLQAPS